MRTIICKKCGATIDADLGMCPNCGAVYYILSDDSVPQPQQDDTQWNDFNAAPRGSESTESRDFSDEDLFKTRIINPVNDPDETQIFRAAPNPTPRQAPPRPVPPPRPVERRPVSQPQQRRTQAPPPPPPPEKKGMDKRKKQLIVAAVALLAVLTLVITIMNGVFNFGDKDDDNNTMIQVVGQTEETATKLLKAMGLEVETMLEENEASEGTVIKQSQKEGKKVKKGDLIILTISKGMKEDEPTDEIEYIEVPNLTGKSYEQARKELTELELVTTRAEDIFSSVEMGNVVSQNPLSGAKLKKGDIVTLTVSKGEKPSPEPEGHTITVTAGKGGSISPKGLVTVKDGSDQSFTITPDAGYEIREIKVDGTSIGAVSSYTFTKVTGDHTIYAVFQEKREPTPSPSPPPTSTPTPTPSPTQTPAPEGQGTASDNNQTA